MVFDLSLRGSFRAKHRGLVCVRYMGSCCYWQTGFLFLARDIPGDNVCIQGSWIIYYEWMCFGRPQ